MCLITNTQEPSLAQEDIKVYKVVHIVDGKYYAPYMQCELTSYAASNVLQATNQFASVLYEVREQGVHAFLKYGSAKELLDYLNDRHKGSQHTIITGIVPNGTYYWSDKKGNIAAKYIKWSTEYKENWFKRLIHKIF